MPLTLTDRDLESISRTATVCASPLDHPDADAWRAAVNRELRALVGADSAGFMLPGTAGPLLLSEEHDPRELARFPEMDPPRRSDGVDVWQKAMRDRVTTIGSLYGADLPAYHASAYYNEYASPNGAGDTLGATVALTSDNPAMLSAAGVQLWRAGRRARGARSVRISAFGARDAQLLHLIYPSLAAGIATARQWQAGRAALLELIDVLPHPGLLCDADGLPIHESAALSRLFGGEASAALLRDALARLAKQFALRHGAPIAVSSHCALPPLQVRTTAAVYEAHAVHGPRLGTGDRRSILVTLTRLTQAVPTPDSLQHAFGLTRAESRVAILLAQGASNAGVAHALSVRPSTARRHTERVLQKLGINSRAAVASRIAGSR